MKDIPMRTLILTATAAALTLSATSWANAQQREALTKQVDIMASIIETAMSHKKGHERKPSWTERSQLESSYLAGQGVVYRIHLGSRLPRFGFPVPPLPPIPGGAHVEFIEVDEVEFIESDELAPRIEKVVEIAAGDNRRVEVIVDSNAIHIDGDEIHFDGDMTMSTELRQAVTAMRDAAKDMRDARRVIRDLSQVDKDASESAAAQSAQQLAAAQAKLAQAQQKMDTARAELRSSKGQIEQRSSARKQAMQQVRAERIAAFEQTFVQTLCDYGDTLRDLPNNEHISVIMVGGGDNDSDKIHVFRKQDVVRCNGEQGASELLTKAISYSF
jgi:hypothetical protein